MVEELKQQLDPNGLIESFRQRPFAYAPASTQSRELFCAKIIHFKSIHNLWTYLRAVWILLRESSNLDRTRQLKDTRKPIFSVHNARDQASNIVVIAMATAEGLRNSRLGLFMSRCPMSSSRMTNPVYMTTAPHPIIAAANTINSCTLSFLSGRRAVPFVRSYSSLNTLTSKSPLKQ